MKSDHLFAVIIFNHVYIMLGAEINVSPSLKPAGLTCYLEILLLALSVFLRLLGETWPEHLTTVMVPQGFLKLFCRTGLTPHNIYKHMCAHRKLR